MIQDPSGLVVGHKGNDALRVVETSAYLRCGQHLRQAAQPAKKIENRWNNRPTL